MADALIACTGLRKDDVVVQPLHDQRCFGVAGEHVLARVLSPA
jgi:hypothetical protein